MQESRAKSLELAIQIFCNPFDPCPGGPKRSTNWNDRTFQDLLELADHLYNFIIRKSSVDSRGPITFDPLNDIKRDSSNFPPLIK